MTITNGHVINGREPLKLVKVVEPDGKPVHQLPEQQPVAAQEQEAKKRRMRQLRAALTHERTRKAGRLVVRHGSYVGGGTAIVVRRTWEARTTARYERMLRSAEAAGNPEEAREWEERAHRFREARHKRRMDLLKAPAEVAKGAATAAVTATGGLLALGGVYAVATGQLGDVLVPIGLAVELVRWAVFIGTVVWGPALMAGPILALAAVWNVGRRGQAAPQWALPADASKRDVVPDEGAILSALKNLGIPPLNKAFKEGWQPRWVSGTGRLGNGWHSQLQLPLGVTVEMINDKKPVLAHNLMRLAIEVWPTEPRNQPGVLDLWVADQGSLSSKVPPWPLLTEGTTDYFKGVPAGVSQRGDNILARLMACNYMIGGIMGTGKSSLVILLLLGAMLDPIVDIDVYCMAYNVDYDPLRPRLRTLVKGDEDEQIEAAIHALRDLRDDVTLRGKLLEELGGQEVRLTREIALRDPRMRPRVVVFDECHELFMHKQYGGEAEELAIKVMKKARKLGITLIWATVSPTADSIPKDVTRNTNHNVAFAVGDHIANDGLLGTGKHRAGISATTLNASEDIGTAVTVGFTKALFELIRTYYVYKNATADLITPVVERALALVGGPVVAAPAPIHVDHLADVMSVFALDDRRVRATEVVLRLKVLNKFEYARWNSTTVAELLQKFGEDTDILDGFPVVKRERVLQALATRDGEADIDQ